MAITTTISTRTSAPSGPDWAAILLAAKQGATDGINEWLNTACMDGGWVNAMVGCFAAPLIKSDLQWISPRVNASVAPVVSAQIPGNKGAPIAQAISLEIAHAWSAWAADFHYPLTRSVGFPTFALWPGPVANPTPPKPPIGKLQVVDGISNASARLTQATFASRLRAALETAGAMSLTSSPAAGALAAQSTMAKPASLTQQMRAGAMPASVTQQMQLGKSSASVTQQIKIANTLASATQQLKVPSALTSAAQPMKLATAPPVGSFAATTAAKSAPAGSTSPRRYASVVSNSNVAVPGPQEFADQLGAWISASFSRWATSAYFDSIMGQGPCPAFAPPYVPAAMVVGGTLTGILHCQAFGI